MTDSTAQREREFTDYLNALLARAWKDGGGGLRGIRFDEFSDYEQETIALAFFNSDYGANGLVDYVACHQRELLDLTLRGLVCIGASRLAAIVREYYDLLRECEYSFGESELGVYEFIETQSDSVQERLDDLQAEADDLYSDFYARWWRYHFERQSLV